MKKLAMASGRPERQGRGFRQTRRDEDHAPNLGNAAARRGGPPQRPAARNAPFA